MTITINSLPNVAALAYSAARSSIRSGDILLCSGTSLISRMIQNATKSIWSHVALKIRVNTSAYHYHSLTKNTLTCLQNKNS